MNATIPPRLDAPTLQDRLAAGQALKILDVRTPGEFESVHIPGSYNVPLETLGEHRAEIARRLAEPVVLVCRSGNRAAQAEQQLRTAGLGNLAVLDGGMLAWEAAGAPVRRSRPRWDLERQVRLVAGSLVLGSVLSSLKFGPAKWLAAGIGAGLTFAALSNTCTMGRLLSKLPYNRGATCDLVAVVDQLTAPNHAAATP